MRTMNGKVESSKTVEKLSKRVLENSRQLSKTDENSEKLSKTVLLLQQTEETKDPNSKKKEGEYCSVLAMHPIACLECASF